MPRGDGPDADTANIDRQIAVNFTGVIHTVQKMLPLLRNPSSVILNATAMVELGIAGMSIYAPATTQATSWARTCSWTAASRHSEAGPGADRF